MAGVRKITDGIGMPLYHTIYFRLNSNSNSLISDAATSYSYTFDSSLPSYIWWESTSSTSSDLSIACSGTGSGGTLLKSIYQNAASITTNPPYTVTGTSTSGAYQCTVTNNGDNVFLTQHTTEVLVVSKYILTVSSSRFPCLTIYSYARLYKFTFM